MSSLAIPMCMRDLDSNFIYLLNHIQVPVDVNSHINAGSSQVQCWCCLNLLSFDTPVHPPVVPWSVFEGHPVI